MNYYRKRQADLSQEAMDWQMHFGESSHSWGELADVGEYFSRLGKRYGLLREFKENGII